LYLLAKALARTRCAANAARYPIELEIAELITPPNRRSGLDG
jgi:hypothetical protein